jgi:hypothetical protein
MNSVQIQPDLHSVIKVLDNNNNNRQTFGIFNANVWVCMRVWVMQVCERERESNANTILKKGMHLKLACVRLIVSRAYNCEYTKANGGKSSLSRTKEKKKKKCVLALCSIHNAVKLWETL